LYRSGRRRTFRKWGRTLGCEEIRSRKFEGRTGEEEDKSFVDRVEQSGGRGDSQTTTLGKRAINESALVVHATRWKIGK